MNMLLKVLLIPFGYIFYAISWILPKKKNRFVFGAWYGQKYADSPKFLFEYTQKNHPEIESWWITKNKRIAHELSLKGYPTLNAFNPYTWWIVATANVAFISIGSRDILTYALTSRHFTVQLWHGIPLKKIGFDEIKKHFFIYWGTRICPWYRLRYSLFPTTADFTQQLFSNAFQLASVNCPVLGSPRNEVLLKKTSLKEKVILYAPTYRKTKNYLSDFIAQLNQSELFLAKINFKLTTRMHFANAAFLKESKLQHHDWIISDKTDDATEALLKSHVLITDFSSIMFDYLLLDRPIIFYVPDLQEYQKNERQLYYNFLDFVPGPILHKWSDVLLELEKILIHGEDSYQQKRQEVKNRFHLYQDGQDCKRIINHVKTKLNFSVS